MRYLVAILFFVTASTAFADQRTSLYLLSNSDAQNLFKGFYFALAKSPDNQAVDWRNPTTGLAGSTVPLRSFQSSGGVVCREYMSTVQFRGSIQQAFGTACRQSGGNWQIIGEKPVTRSPQAMKFVYVRQQAPQQVSQTCPFNHSRPSLEQSQGKQLHRGYDLDSDRFHEKSRTFEGDRQQRTSPRKIEEQQPSRFLKLVSY